MKRLTFYTNEKISQARLVFRQLTINSIDDGNRFFEAFCPGNTINVADRPFERFQDYETFLKILRDDDQIKYEKIHKGTPFYFLAWTAFDLKNYEKAVFYMDAAISEDIRALPKNWINTPASQFITLNHEGNQAAKGITEELRNEVLDQLNRFNAISGLNSIDIDSFVNNFVKFLVIQKENHSIITALYSYLLEFKDIYLALLLRSTEGGSIEPALTYLFKGSLIFESLLKHLYPNKDNRRDKCETLGDVFKTSAFKTEFTTTRISTTASTLEEILRSIGGNGLHTAFTVTSKLRNTTGHNLTWVDVFDEPDNLKKFYEQQVNAILYIAQKKFLEH